jgi:hypothetical protein
MRSKHRPPLIFVGFDLCWLLCLCGVVRARQPTLPMDTDDQMRGLTCRKPTDTSTDTSTDSFLCRPLRITHESISSDKASRESN